MGFLDGFIDSITGAVGWAVDHADDMARVAAAVAGLVGEDADRRGIDTDIDTLPALIHNMTIMDKKMFDDYSPDNLPTITQAIALRGLWTDPVPSYSSSAPSQGTYAPLVNTLSAHGMPMLVKLTNGDTLDLANAISDRGFGNFAMSPSELKTDGLKVVSSKFNDQDNYPGVKFSGVMTTYPIIMNEMTSSRVNYAVLKLQFDTGQSHILKPRNLHLVGRKHKGNGNLKTTFTLSASFSYSIDAGGWVDSALKIARLAPGEEWAIDTVALSDTSFKFRVVTPKDTVTSGQLVGELQKAFTLSRPKNGTTISSGGDIGPLAQYQLPTISSDT